jgi:hypothetical protein
MISHAAVHGDSQHLPAHPASIPLDTIRDPGSYVCNWSGYLLRVPDGTLGQGGREINIVGNAPLLVTKISDDPEIPVSRARRMAADFNLPIRF